MNIHDTLDVTCDVSAARGPRTRSVTAQGDSESKPTQTVERKRVGGAGIGINTHRQKKKMNVFLVGAGE